MDSKTFKLILVIFSIYNAIAIVLAVLLYHCHHS
jgi:hypothetical protein